MKAWASTIAFSVLKNFVIEVTSMSSEALRAPSTGEPGTTSSPLVSSSCSVSGWLEPDRLSTRLQTDAILSFTPSELPLNPTSCGVVAPRRPVNLIRLESVAKLHSFLLPGWVVSPCVNSVPSSVT